MRKFAVLMAVGMAIALLGASPLQAAGVFIVSPKGVEAFEGAKAGFIQMAYGVQMPGLNPKTVDLDGSAADDAALSALAAQNPRWSSPWAPRRPGRSGRPCPRSGSSTAWCTSPSPRAS